MRGLSRRSHGRPRRVSGGIRDHWCGLKGWDKALLLHEVSGPRVVAKGRPFSQVGLHQWSTEKNDQGGPDGGRRIALLRRYRRQEDPFRLTASSHLTQRWRKADSNSSSPTAVFELAG